MPRHPTATSLACPSSTPMSTSSPFAPSTTGRWRRFTSLSLSLPPSSEGNRLKMPRHLISPRLEPLASRPLVECTTSSSSPALALLRSTPFPSTDLSSLPIYFVRLNPIYLCQTSSLLVWFGVRVRVNHCGSSYRLLCCV